jgi:signal transduction histidine kinase
MPGARVRTDVGISGGMTSVADGTGISYLVSTRRCEAPPPMAFYSGNVMILGRAKSVDIPATSPVPGLRTPGWVTLVAPALALIVVGASTFPAPYGPTRNLINEIVAFAVSVVTMGMWRASEYSVALRRRLAPVLPWSAGVMLVACGWASLSNNGGPFSILSSAATVGAGASFSFPVASAVTGTGVVAVMAAGLGYGVGTFGTFGYPLIMVLGLLFGRLIRGYRVQAEQSAALMSNSEQLQQEQRRSATLDERNRIAREIHDVLAHSLGSLGVQIQAAQAVLTDQRDIERAVELLNQARRAATDGLNETRRALLALRAGTPPLAEALADLSTSHRRHYGAQVGFEVSGETRSLSADAELALTRTGQEALVNAAKHAAHQPVQVRLDYDEGRTTLTVINQLSKGMADCSTLETVNGGYGLAGMRERLLLIDGSLRAGPDHGDWVVTAQVPQ